MSDHSELKRLAEAATPQNFDSAEEKSENGYIECPHCSGQGEVELEADYCNYDGQAIGVQFYGIGHEFGAAEAYYRAANPAAVLALIAEVQALRKDAERYRWLRGVTASAEPGVEAPDFPVIASLSDIYYTDIFTGAEADAAVDAAMNNGDQP